MAPWADFLGGSYTGRALAADGERSANVYPERIESRGGTASGEYVLLSKPGLAPFCASIASTGTQCVYAINGRGFVVSGNTLYELASDGSQQNRGALSSGARVVMCANQNQLLIVAGGDGFIFDLHADTLTQITASGWIEGATQAACIDGYFIILEPDSQAFAISALNDGTEWDPLDFGDAEGESGNVVGMIADHRQLWLFGNNHSEVYYDSGTATFPFSRLEGAFSEQGLAAIDTLTRCDNTIFWLGANADGAGIVWRANGYTPQRVSNHCVEAAIASYGTVSDATAYTYQDGGHTFYRLDFPSANSGRGATWLFDVSTGFWHERTWLSNGLEYADLARFHMYVFGKHIVGDYQSGNIYEQTSTACTDAGAPIRRLRAAPDLRKGGRWSFYSELRLLVQTGVGLDGPATQPGYDPQITLQVSRDGGFTWGKERTISMGKLGQYSLLVRWSRLGRARNFCVRIICTAPVFFAIVGADLDSQ